MGTAFDLIHGPLLRVKLIKTGPEEHLLRLTGHHVVIDGWSMGILMADISRIYSALSSRKGTSARARDPLQRLRRWR
jgi:NRPS condensation-like uncharacterized protein